MKKTQKNEWRNIPGINEPVRVVRKVTESVLMQKLAEGEKKEIDSGVYIEIKKG